MSIALCWKIIFFLPVFMTVGFNIYYLMAWHEEYQTLVEQMKLKRQVYGIRCHNKEEIKSDRAMQRECGELEKAMARIQDPVMVSFANTGEALRLCGNQDCFVLFSNIAGRFVGETMNFVWFFMMASIALGIIILLIMWTLWSIFGRRAFGVRKKKKSLPMTRQVMSIEDITPNNEKLD
jgi:hypothetical protein